MSSSPLNDEIVSSNVHASQKRDAHSELLVHHDEKQETLVILESNDTQLFSASYPYSNIYPHCTLPDHYFEASKKTSSHASPPLSCNYVVSRGIPKRRFDQSAAAETSTAVPQTAKRSFFTIETWEGRPVMSVEAV
ncbi:MAG: hypothetical protein KDD60_07880 [Bdellovibrionales bacterium]|nr:hypothetical protein [Bdellovibrionales bacterium]